MEKLQGKIDLFCMCLTLQKKERNIKLPNRISKETITYFFYFQKIMNQFYLFFSFLRKKLNKQKWILLICLGLISRQLTFLFSRRRRRKKVFICDQLFIFKLINCRK